MTAPMISVVMPVYNAEKYITEAVESILNQTYSDFEFIIVDDCSTDNSYEILQSYAANDARIRLFKNDVNSKLPKTLNFGISQAKGKYIARMDADDISLPERFAKQVAFMDANPEIGVSGGYAAVLGGDESGVIMKVQITHGLIKAYSFFVCCNLIHPTVIMRMEVLENRALSYDEELVGVAEDYDLWVRMLHSGVLFANLPEPLLYYRKSEMQVTNKFEAQIAKFSQSVVDHNLCLLFGRSISQKLYKQHKFYVQEPSFIKLLANFYGFYSYSKKMCEANKSSMIISIEEMKIFLTKLNPFVKVINRLKNLFSIGLT